MGPPPSWEPIREVSSWTDPGDLPRPATGSQFADWTSRLDAARTWSRSATTRGVPPEEILRERARRLSPAFQEGVRHLEERAENISARAARNGFALLEAQRDAWRSALCVALEKIPAEDRLRLLLSGNRGAVSDDLVGWYCERKDRPETVPVTDVDFRCLEGRIWRERKQ